MDLSGSDFRTDLRPILGIRFRKPVGLLGGSAHSIATGRWCACFTVSGYPRCHLGEASQADSHSTRSSLVPNNSRVAQDLSLPSRPPHCLNCPDPDVSSAVALDQSAMSDRISRSAEIPCAHPAHGDARAFLIAPFLSRTSPSTPAGLMVVAV